LLINGYDLLVEPDDAYEFVMAGLARGEFRFARILAWLQEHAVET
jgi:prophage maintenance system killer protein